MLKIFYFLFFTLLTGLSYANNQYTPDIVIKNFIRGSSKDEILRCALSDNKMCQEALGYAYLFGEPIGSDYIEKNILEAKKWLSSSLIKPYSRYLLGELNLELFLHDSSGDNLYGLSLIHSSCEEGTIDACVRLIRIYENDSHVYGGIIDEFNVKENLKRAEFFNKKSIDLVKERLQVFRILSIEDKLEKQSMNDDLKRYKERLANIQILQGKKDAVKILEELTINDSSFDGGPLADVYAEGKIVPQDLVKAYMYYDLSGGNEDKKARIAQRMTPNQIKEAVEESWNWQQQHHSYRPGYRSPEDYDF